MKKTLSGVAVLLLFGSFASASVALASTKDGALVVNMDNETAQPLGPTESTGPICIVDEPSAAWTRDDCVKAWKMNVMGCNASPPNLRPACWAAASALMAACLAASKG